MLVGTFLGAKRAPIAYDNDGVKCRLSVGKKILGEIKPIGGADETQEVKVTNTQYWMGLDMTVAKTNKDRVRAFGHVWDFEGRSAEICQIDWKG